ncbi:hypothetical protein GCM10010222_12420 [Streptomyces tanashiensis]|nr:hypothetical protein GCM10010222_12420 [Streptomyces tanashiensis]
MTAAMAIAAVTPMKGLRGRAPRAWLSFGFLCLDMHTSTLWSEDWVRGSLSEPPGEEFGQTGEWSKNPFRYLRHRI